MIWTSKPLNEAGDGFDIRHTLVFVEKSGMARVRAAGLALPLMLGSDFNRIRTTVGGEKLNDAWRVDQTDEVVSTSTVSDWFPAGRSGNSAGCCRTHRRITASGRRARGMLLP